MEGRLFGVGLGNALALFVFFIIMIVGLKAILGQHKVNGLSEVIMAV